MGRLRANPLPVEGSPPAPNLLFKRGYTIKRRRIARHDCIDNRLPNRPKAALCLNFRAKPTPTAALILLDFEPLRTEFVEHEADVADML